MRVIDPFQSVPAKRLSAKLFLVAGAVSLGALLVLSGCAANEPAADSLKVAGNAIGRADESRVSDYAVDDMRAARRKLAEAHDLAQKAALDNDPVETRHARWLAEEAHADVDLATARAENARSQEINFNLQRSLDGLQAQAPAPSEPEFAPETAAPAPESGS